MCTNNYSVWDSRGYLANYRSFYDTRCSKMFQSLSQSLSLSPTHAHTLNPSPQHPHHPQTQQQHILTHLAQLVLLLHLSVAVEVPQPGVDLQPAVKPLLRVALRWWQHRSADGELHAGLLIHHLSESEWVSEWVRKQKWKKETYV